MRCVVNYVFKYINDKQTLPSVCCLIEISNTAEGFQGLFCLIEQQEVGNQYSLFGKHTNVGAFLCQLLFCYFYY